jgi:molecular chaperone IbpA
MSQLRTFDPSALSNINRALIGFDRLFNGSVPHTSNYPPYNIVRYDESRYGIEIAVAGFDREEITVEVNQDQLSVKGVRRKNEGEKIEYLHRGLAYRDFEQTYTLAEYMVVQSATVQDGMLKVTIERVIPEALKPRMITIT